MSNAFVKSLSRNADFVWDAVMEYTPGKARRSRTNYVNFNCPMCQLRGETPDTKQRCGVSKTYELTEGVRASCFNCGFSTTFKVGQRLSDNFKLFLSKLGMDSRDIDVLNHRASAMARVLEDSGVTEFSNPNRFVPNFPQVELPPDTHPLTMWADLGLDDPDFIEAVAYAMTRGDEVIDRAYWSPDEKWKHRLIFPCLWRGTVVGWTGRLVRASDPLNPKYLNEVPANYLSNCDVMNDATRKYLLMPEGYLDAEVIDGISPFGAKLNENQVSWIKESGKTVIVIPDRDRSGQRLVDIAIQNEWRVAFPRLTLGGNNWWEEDCKDCAEAVKRYGRLYTLRSIIETSTDRRLEIETRRKWLY